MLFSLIPFSEHIFSIYNRNVMARLICTNTNIRKTLGFPIFCLFFSSLRVCYSNSFSFHQSFVLLSCSAQKSQSEIRYLSSFPFFCDLCPSSFPLSLFSHLPRYESQQCCYADAYIAFTSFSQRFYVYSSIDFLI